MKYNYTLPLTLSIALLGVFADSVGSVLHAMPEDPDVIQQLEQELSEPATTEVAEAMNTALSEPEVSPATAEAAAPVDNNATESLDNLASEVVPQEQPTQTQLVEQSSLDDLGNTAEAINAVAADPSQAASSETQASEESASFNTIDSNVPVDESEGTKNEDLQYAAEVPAESLPSSASPFQGSESTGTVEIAADDNQPDQAVRFVSPTQDYVSDSFSTQVVLEAPLGSDVRLFVNGREVPQNQIGELQTDSREGVVRQTWIGVTLYPGTNLLAATATLNGQTSHNSIFVWAPDEAESLPSSASPFQGSESTGTVEIAADDNQPDQAVRFVSPTQDYVNDSFSTQVVLEAPLGSDIRLSVNGREVPQNQIGELRTDSREGVVRQTWIGVTLSPGANLLEATATLNGQTSHNSIFVWAPDEAESLPSSASPFQGSESTGTVEIAADDNQPDQAVRFVSPTQGYVSDSISTQVVLEAPLGSDIRLSVSGREVPQNQIGELRTDSREGVVRQTWIGIILSPGNNVLTATATLNGQTSQSSIEVWAPDEVDDLEVKSRGTSIPADGRSTILIEGTLLDENDNRSNRGGVVTLETTAGEFVGEDINESDKGFQVRAEDGQFQAILRSGVISGATQVRATLSDLEAYTQVQFETALRPSLAAGVISLRVGADNSDYFSSFRDFLNPDSNGSSVVDIDGSGFAIGPVGEWLLTAAYNGDRTLNDVCNTCSSRLFNDNQPSEELYLNYGDDSQVTNITPSEDSLYLRLERSSGIVGAEPDYVMWGDYGTSHEFANSSQEFSALSRTLHGAKLNYNLGDLQFSALYSQGGESFQRDTLAPDGTSGFYFLTQRDVVRGSEQIYFELEELERPGTVLQRERLRRVSDYEIDYDRGTIVFEEPVLRTELSDEGELLVRRIVATYQYESDVDNKAYAGRLKYSLDRTQNQESWIGTTYFQEDAGERDLSVFGVDAQVHFGKDYKLIAEYARSSNDSDIGGEVTGSAYRAEFTGRFSDSLTGRAYYRHADTGFSNRSTISFVPGQTRYGADFTAKLSDTTQLNLRYDHEKNEGVNIRPIVTLGDLLNAGEEALTDSFVDNELTTVALGVNQKIGKGTLSSELLFRDRTDNTDTDRNGTSSQLRTTFTTPITRDLKFRLNNQTTLSESSDAVYSDKTQIGLDWRIANGVNLDFNQNWYTSGQLAGQYTTSIGLRGEYKVFHNTTLTGRYDVERFSEGMKDSAAFGLRHRWAMFDNFDVDVTYERVFGNLFFASDGAVGQGASRSVGVKGGDSFTIRGRYTGDPDLQAELGYEYRNTNGRRAANISGSVSGRISDSLTAIADFDRRFSSGQATRGLAASTNLRLGLAYRDPESDKFNALLRYEYRKNPDTIPESLLIGDGDNTTEHLIAAEAIYAPDPRWELYTKLGYRNSAVQLSDDFEATSATALAQFRATYQLNERFDLTGGLRLLGQPSAGYSEMGYLAEVGYHVTPALRLAAGYSSGEVNNDRDFGGTRADGGFYFGANLVLDNLFGFGDQKPIANELDSVVTAEIPELAAATKAQEVVEAPLRVDLSREINFEDDSNILSIEGKAVLQSMVTVLRRYKDIQVDIQGVLPPLAELTSDNLDAQRLQAARDYLVKRGISGQRIILRSIAIGSTEEAIAQAEGTTNPVTFAISATPSTLKLISSQVNDNDLFSNLFADRPELAALIEDESASTADEAQASIPESDVIEVSETQPGQDVPVAANTEPVVENPLAQINTPSSGLQLLTEGFTESDQFLSKLDFDIDRGSDVSAEEFPGGLVLGSQSMILASRDEAVPAATDEVLATANDGTEPEDRFFFSSGETEPLILGDRRLDELTAAELEALAPQLFGAVFTEDESFELFTQRLNTPEDDIQFVFGSSNIEPLILGDRRIDELSGEKLEAISPESFDLVLNTDATADLFARRDSNSPETFFFGNANLEPIILGDRRLDTLEPIDNSSAIDAIFGRAAELDILALETTGESQEQVADNSTLALAEPDDPITALEARRLASALTFLLADDLTTLDAILQATGEQAPEIRGQEINLDTVL